MASILQAYGRISTLPSLKVKESELFQQFFNALFPGKGREISMDPNSYPTNLFCMYPQANDFSQTLGFFLHTVKRLNQIISL